ncbi:MAG: mechanosensitive ion channel family protein [Gemmataceae bacterium]
MTEAIWQTLTSRKIILGSLGVFVLAIGGLWLADPDAFPVGPFTEAEQPGPPLPVDDGKPPASEAEHVARLQRSVEEQRKYLDKLRAQLNDPKSEYKEAEQRFQTVDAERETARQAIEDLKKTGKMAEAAARVSALKDIEIRWQKCRDLFDAAFQEHKALQESIFVSTRQLHDEEQALAQLSGTSEPSPSPPPASGRDETASAASGGAAAPKAAQSASPPRSLLPLPTTPFSLAASASASNPSAPANAATPAPSDAVSREVERAREEAKRKEEAAKKAENKAQSISQQIDDLNENIALTKKLLEEARQQAKNEQQAKSELEAQLRQKRSAKVPESDLHDLDVRIQAAERRFQKELGAVHTTTNHLHDLQTELNYLQATQIRALREADDSKKAAEAAEEKIAQLQNPFRPRNIVHWLLHHGPRLFLVALGTLIFHRLSRAFSRRVVQLMSQGTSKRGTRQDRENRAQTLAGVFNSALSLLILGGGSLMMLDEVGIPIVPLMGGAAVIGLAVAFGAQNLIKDYFSGFMVLLEDQYGINDVVQIGAVSGMVEHISLRTTVLRDLEGIVHFVPHGTITTVSNQTHGWSRALFDVGIDYKENVDRVMQVLLELGHEMRNDPMFGPLILDDPEMLGVDNLADSSVILKFFIKTRPLQQWTVKREMLRRIKKRFDELGIEIPYPHQTVHHRYDAPPSSLTHPSLPTEEEGRGRGEPPFRRAV